MFTAYTFRIRSYSIHYKLKFSDVDEQEAIVLMPDQIRVPVSGKSYVPMYRITKGYMSLSDIRQSYQLIGFNVKDKMHGIESEYTREWIVEWLNQFSGATYPIIGSIRDRKESVGVADLGFVLTDDTDAMLFKLGCPFELETTILTDQNFI
jgi:hypothetical protein